MGFHKFVAVLAFCSIIGLANGEFNISCRTANTCFCTMSMYDSEFQCPNDRDMKFILKIQPTYRLVTMDCLELPIDWLYEVMPLVEVGDVDYFRFQRCSRPRNFAEIMNRLKITSTKELSFDTSPDFANVTLTADYFEGVRNLQRLVLNGNDIRNIDENAFGSLDNLVELDLKHNKLELSHGIFANLSNLKLLDLADNHLTDLPSDIFQNLSELKELHLWLNKFTTINGDVFKNLRNLEILELSRNPIQYLPEDAFHHLKNLKQISLSANELKSVPENLFSTNVLVKSIKMNRNKYLTFLPNNLFSNLPALGNIWLDDCNLSSLPSSLFNGSRHLQNITLRMNKIEHIPDNIFKDLADMLNLDLGYNKIEDLPDSVFSSMSRLKTLNLQDNLLISVRREPFNNLIGLEKLNLKNNKINHIAIDAFRPVYNLKEIILANNEFDLPVSPHISDLTLFSNNQELRKIDLSNNNITTIGNLIVLNSYLQEVDFSYNQIPYLAFNQIFTVSFPIEINLKHNKISTVNFNNAEAISEGQGRLDAVYSPNNGNRKVYLDGNPLECDCFLYDFVRYLDGSISPEVLTLVTVKIDSLSCASPSDFINFPANQLKPNMLSCSIEQLGITDKLTEGCAYGFRPSDKSLVVNCTDADFIEAPELILPEKPFYIQTEVDLQRNFLLTGPRENMGYENVTKLSLSYNRIEEFTWVPPKIKVLQLDNNNISSLNSDVLSKLNSSDLTNITLGQNPWNCDCSTVNVKNFLVSNLAKKWIDADEIKCKNSENLLGNLGDDDMCPSNTALVLGLGITISLMLLSVAATLALYYRFQQEVKVWLFKHKILLRFITEDEIDKDKDYDAFISYSHKDEDFVLKQLLPVLEQGPEPYKLCLHIRDFIAGEFISKQIVETVAKSRRTMVILSRSFLESEWGKMEFRTAHKQALHEGRARVILVIYGNVDLENDLDDEMKAYVRTNTYVKWGDPWFWDKLRYALPHSRIQEKKSQKSHNIMVAINEKLDKLDDRLDLIPDTPVTPNPGSTPPAINVDPLLLKTNPLNFMAVHSLTPPAESGLNPLIIRVEK